jgi:hypothetical protein
MDDNLDITHDKKSLIKQLKLVYNRRKKVLSIIQFIT